MFSIANSHGFTFSEKANAVFTVEGNRAPAGRQWMEAGLELSPPSAGWGGVGK